MTETPETVVPSTEEIENGFVEAVSDFFGGCTPEEGHQFFRLWLRHHDAEMRASALKEAADDINLKASFWEVFSRSDGPVQRKRLAQWLHDRADTLSKKTPQDEEGRRDRA